MGGDRGAVPKSRPIRQRLRDPESLGSRHGGLCPAAGRQPEEPRGSKPHISQGPRLAGLSHFPHSLFQQYFTQMSVRIGPEPQGARCGPGLEQGLTPPHAGEDTAGHSGYWGVLVRDGGPGDEGAGLGGNGSLSRFPFLCHFLSSCVTLLFFLLT